MTAADNAIWLIAISCIVLYYPIPLDGLIVSKGVNEIEQQQIVDIHNGIRQRVIRGQIPHQPKGTNLKQLRWDNTLARKAQKIADTCHVGYRRVVDVRYPCIGQNIYCTSSVLEGGRADWADAIKHWFNKHKNYQFGRKVDWGNRPYMQLVWACTEIIGCGYSYCRVHAVSYQKFYVCNYGPGINCHKNPYNTD